MAVNVVGDFEGGGEVRLSGVLVRQHPNRLSVLREAAHDAEGHVQELLPPPLHPANQPIETALQPRLFSAKFLHEVPYPTCPCHAPQVINKAHFPAELPAVGKRAKDCRDLEQAVHFFNIAAVAENPVRSTFTRDCVVEGILTPDRRRLHESALTDSKSVRLEKLQKGS